MAKRRCRRHRPGLRVSGPAVVSGDEEEPGWRRRRDGERGADARARPQAQPGRAAEAREEPARDARRAAGADRDRVRRHRGGRHRPPQVVGPVPRQAEDRHVHAADQDARAGESRPSSCADRRALERARARRRRADDAPDDPAPLPAARLPAEIFDRLRERRPDDGRARAATRCATSPAAPSPASAPRRALRRHSPARRGDELLLRQPRVLGPASQAQDLDLGLRDHCNAPEINCISLVGALRDGERGLRGARRRRPLIGAPASPASSASWIREDEAMR